MSGNLDMGRFGIRNVRNPSVGSDVATVGYSDRSITGSAAEISTRIDGLSKLTGSSVMTGNSDMGRNSSVIFVNKNENCLKTRK
jgi:hypothetical protein